MRVNPLGVAPLRVKLEEGLSPFSKEETQKDLLLEILKRPGDELQGCSQYRRGPVSSSRIDDSTQSTSHKLDAKSFSLRRKEATEDLYSQSGWLKAEREKEGHP